MSRVANGLRLRSGTILTAYAVALAGCPERFEGVTDAATTGVESSTPESGSTTGSSATGGGASTEADASEGSSADSSSTQTNESSTGSGPSRHGLSFEGGIAITEETALVDFDDAPFTVEMWFRAAPTFQGVLFDTTVAIVGDNGIYLAVGEEYFGNTNLTFQNLGVDAADAPLLVGPDHALFEDWHHVAVTHDPDGTHRMWIDGHLHGSALSPTPIRNADLAAVTIGSRATTPFPPLDGVVVDELRLSTEALYSTDFGPVRPLGIEVGTTLLYWDLDEGTGVIASDAVLGMQMTIDDAVSWVAVD